MKSQRDDIGGRILLGDYTGGRLIRFQRVGVLIPAGLLCLYVGEHSLLYINPIPNCAKFDTNRIIRDVTIVYIWGGGAVQIERTVHRSGPEKQKVLSPLETIQNFSSNFKIFRRRFL